MPRRQFDYLSRISLHSNAPTRPLASPDRTGASGRITPRQNFRALNLLLVVTPQCSPNAGSRSVSGVARAVFIRTVCALISFPRVRPAEMPATHHRAPSDHRAVADKPGQHRSALNNASLVNPGPALDPPLPPRDAIQPRSHLSPTKFHELRETACRSILAMSSVDGSRVARGKLTQWYWSPREQDADFVSAMLRVCA